RGGQASNAIQQHLAPLFGKQVLLGVRALGRRLGAFIRLSLEPPPATDFEAGCNGDVMSDAVDPGPLAGFPAIRRQSSPDGRRDFLHQILAVLARRNISSGQAIECSSVLVEQSEEYRTADLIGLLCG